MSLEGHHQFLIVPAVQLVEHHQAAAVCVCVCIVNVVVRDLTAQKFQLLLKLYHLGEYMYI